MSIFESIITLIPAGIIWVIYSKLMNNHSIEIIIRVYGDSPPRTPMFQKLRAAQMAKTNFKLFLYVSLVAYAALVVNYQKGYVPAWVALIGLSLVLVVLYYLVDTSRNDLLLADGRIDESRRQAFKEELKKGSIIFLALALVVSGNWAYRNMKDLADQKEMAVSEALNLSESGWCSNFADINVYDGGQTVVKSGGWPCIYIGSVNNIRFQMDKKELQICFDVSLNFEEGAPGYEDFQVGYKTEHFCQTDSWYSGLTTDGFKSRLFDIVNPQLEALNQKLCYFYQYRMSPEIRSTYC